MFWSTRQHIKYYWCFHNLSQHGTIYCYSFQVGYSDARRKEKEHGCEQGNAQRNNSEHMSVIIGILDYQLYTETTFCEHMTTGNLWTGYATSL